MNKDDLKTNYLELKALLGKVPTSRDFKAKYKNCEFHLYSAFGDKPFGKLQAYCGDEQQRFGKEKSDLETILTQWGKLARLKNALPNQFDWKLQNFKPTISGIKGSHNLNWSDLPIAFLEKFKNQIEWVDVIDLIPFPKNPEIILKDAECFVYLNINQKREHKIGISIDPKTRERTLMAQDPKIKTIAKKKYINRKIAGAIEKALHDLYKHKRIRGEWFNLDESDLHELKATLND